MLLLDRPVARRSEHELVAEAEKNYTWNFTVNLLDGASFWFGNNFVSAATILPLFVSREHSVIQERVLRAKTR